MQLIPIFQNTLRIYDGEAWKKFVDLNYLLEMLKIFEDVEKK